MSWRVAKWFCLRRWSLISGKVNLESSSVSISFANQIGFSNVLQSIRFSNTSFTYQFHIPGSHKFYTYLSHIRFSHTFSTYVSHIRFSHIFLTNQYHISFSQTFFTNLFHSHTFFTYLLYIPFSHTFLTCLSHISLFTYILSLILHDTQLFFQWLVNFKFELILTNRCSKHH